MSRASIDFSYTHEMAPRVASPSTFSCRLAAARDLTARLRCLKALIDADRDARPPSCAATPGRMH